MSKLVFLMLLVILAVICSQYTVDSHKGIGNRLFKNECNCKVLPNNKLNCRKGLIPRTRDDRFQLMECLCKKHRHELDKKLDIPLQNTCKKLYKGFSIPLPLA